MSKWRVTVQSDTGKAHIRVSAVDVATAKAKVMAAEGCPESAIIKTKELRKKKAKNSSTDNDQSAADDYLDHLNSRY